MQRGQSGERGCQQSSGLVDRRVPQRMLSVLSERREQECRVEASQDRVDDRPRIDCSFQGMFSEQRS